MKQYKSLHKTSLIVYHLIFKIFPPEILPINVLGFY